MNTDAFKAALRGARLLDERVPNWRRRIVRSRLRLSSGYMPTRESCGCVLTQLAPRREDGTRTYDDGVRAIGATHLDGERYGFIAADDYSYGYDDLDEAWQTILAEKLS